MSWRAVIAIAMTVPSLDGLAVAEEVVPPQMQGATIEERPGAQVPLDLVLKDADGRVATLGSYLADGKPAVLVLAYYRCPMLCSLVVNGLSDGLKELDWSAGQQYRVLVVSFDPRDTTQIAHDKRENYLKEYGRPVPRGGFELLTGDSGSVRRLADAVGFGYRWDEASGQFAHAAGAFVLTPDGRLSRTLYGISFPGKDLRLALVEASKGELGSAWDRVVLFCYHYDSSARGYVLAATRLMRVGGAATLLLLGLLLYRLVRGARQATVAHEKAG
ncbi:MAG: SCO family protein [Deltaproteobacteria bacterium]|nr:SCO family protein [Deltaproteobacteria bacterium]